MSTVCPHGVSTIERCFLCEKNPKKAHRQGDVAFVSFFLGTVFGLALMALMFYFLNG